MQFPRKARGKVMIKSLLLGVAILGLGGAGGAAAYHFMTSGEATSPDGDGEHTEDASEHASPEIADSHTEATDAPSFNLIGIWAPEGEYCASGAGMHFKTGGKYVTEDVDGSWKLVGQSFQLNDGTQTFRGKLHAVSEHEFSIAWSDGDTSKYRRCTPNGAEPWFSDKNSRERNTEASALTALTRSDWAALDGPPSCEFKADGQTLLVTDGDTARVRDKTGEDYQYRDATTSENDGKLKFAMSIGTGIPPSLIVIAPRGGSRNRPEAPATLQMLAQSDYDAPIRVLWEKSGTLTCPTS